MKQLFMLFMLFSSIKAVSKGAGIGIIVGTPTGISFKYWLYRKEAFDAVIGWSNGRYMHFHMNYLYHFPQPSKEAQMIPYIGIGGVIKVKENDLVIGARVVGGFEIYYYPVGVFGEIAPVINILPPGAEANIGLGLRFYFL